MNGDVLFIASQANIGGATTAMSLAGSQTSSRPDSAWRGRGHARQRPRHYAGIAIAYLSKSLIG